MAAVNALHALGSDMLLVIDDDATLNSVLVRALQRHGQAARGTTDPLTALATAVGLAPQRIVLDLNLGNASGLNLIGPLLAKLPACRIVVLTGYGSIATAVEAIKLGAHQYLTKPATAESILAAFADDGEDGGTFLPNEPLPVDRLEWEHLQRILREHDGNISATARALKMHRRTLQRKLLRHQGSN